MATASVRLKEEYSFQKLFRELKLHTEVGVRFYGQQKKHKEGLEVIYALYSDLNELLPNAKKYQEFISLQAPHYDFIDANGTRVKGNGYRSILFVFKSCCERLVKHLKACSKEREGMFNSAFGHFKSIAPHASAFKGLTIVLKMAVCLIKSDMRISDKRHLFIEGEVSQAAFRMVLLEDVDRECYYGPCLGFQYSSYLKNLLQAIVITMATYEKWFNSAKTDPVKEALESIIKGTRYIRNSTGRGEKIAELTQHSSIDFTKAFWATFEMDAIRKFVKLVCPTMETAVEMKIPAKDLTLEGDRGTVTLHPPFSDIGYSPIPVKLLSCRRKEGQNIPGAYANRCITVTPPSPGLVIHVHGGGFVSQSVKSHEGYLRPLAKELDVPILSINYSHAPEAPFPRAFDECTYVYAWALQNVEQLGSTGERIVLLGDSAGGNLVVSVALKAKELGLRVPDAVVSVYPALLCRTVISPSRSLSIMDPLLPIGILLSCLQAYTGASPDKTTLAKRQELRAKIQLHKGKKPHSDDSDDLLEEEDGTFPTKRSNSVVSRSQSLRQAVRTMSTVNKSDVQKKPPSRPPLPSNSPSLKRTQSLQVKSSPPPRPPPPRSNTVPSLPVVPPPEQPIIETLPTPGFLEADKDVSSDFQEKEELESVLESVIIEEGEDSFKEESTAPVLFPTDMKEDVLTPAKYPPEIEALAGEVLQSYQDSRICLDPFVSPYMAPPEMWKGLPPINFVACELDPLLDDSVAMAQKLKSYGHQVSLSVMPGLCHGFLSLAGNPDVSKAIDTVTALLKKGLNIPVKK